MTVSSVKTGDLGISFALNNNYMEPIGTTLLTSTSSIVTFDDIPQIYKHLQLRTSINNAVGDTSHQIRLNSDSGASYTNHYFYGNGTTIFSNGGGAGTTPYLIYGTATTSIVAGSVCDILDYASSTKNKTIRTLSGFELNNPGSVAILGGAWLSVNPIVSLSVVAYGTNTFNANSRFSLYGIKG